MDSQNNNMFNNMIQPSGVPEVKDNNTVANNSFNNLASASNEPVNSLNGGLNQMNSSVQNNGGVFGNVDPLASNGLNDMFSSTSVNPNNTGVMDSGNVANNTLDSSINVLPSDNASNLSFVPPVNAVNDNLGQSLGQPTSGVMDFNIGNATSSVVDNNATIGMSTNNLDMQSNVETNVVNNSLETNVPNNASINSGEVKTEVVSVKTYVINLLLFCIPLVGMIMLIVKAVDKKESSIRNLARAQLIVSAIFVLLSVVLTIVSTVMLGSLMVNLFG